MNLDDFNVDLKRPRGKIDYARVQSGVALNGDNKTEYRAWIYIGRGKINYAEMQATEEGHTDIKSFFEYGDHPDIGPRYMDMGLITHRKPINSMNDWNEWLTEYAAGIDPYDAFKTYRKSVGGF